MSVVVKPSDVAARPWTVGCDSKKAATVKDLFQMAATKESDQSRGIVASSFFEEDLRDSHISPSSNGFVYSLYLAYNNHHHLTIRPDDVWFAILSQLSIYINGHAEEVREYFVSHKGQKELIVVEGTSIRDIDYSRFLTNMTKHMKDHIKDPDLREWILPSFSTTTDDDLVIGSIFMMGALQKYFAYSCVTACGIPSVTLLGEKADYIQMLEKIEKLSGISEEVGKFAELLRPVISRFARSFDEPKSKDILDFWNCVVDSNSRGSGEYLVFGWLTAFCFWGDEGRLLYGSKGFKDGKSGLELDGVRYHVINPDTIPAGYASVPFKIDDAGTIYHCTALAGSFGIEAESSGQKMDVSGGHEEDGTKQATGKLKTTTRSGKGTGIYGLDSISPLQAWLVYLRDAD